MDSGYIDLNDWWYKACISGVLVVLGLSFNILVSLAGKLRVRLDCLFPWGCDNFGFAVLERVLKPLF